MTAALSMPTNAAPPFLNQTRSQRPRTRVSQPHVTTIKNTVNILEVVGAVVELRRHGKVFCGRCPWHSSKSGTSFQVIPDRATWRCWACNIGGDVFTFVRRYYSLSFADAVQLLARHAGIDITKAPSRELEARVAQQTELARINQELRAAEKAELLRIGSELADARRLYRVAAARLMEIEDGAVLRFDDEQEMSWELMRLANEEIRDADAGYTLIAFGPQEQREAWLRFPERREEMIRAALAQGFVKGKKGIRHQVPAA